MGKVVIKILQGSVVTQTIFLGGLTTYPPVANCLWCICAKTYESWLALGSRQSYCNNKIHDKVIATTRYMFKRTQSMSNASL